MASGSQSISCPVRKSSSPDGAGSGGSGCRSGAAGGSARQPSFALGFLTGQEMDWLPEAMHIL